LPAAGTRQSLAGLNDRDRKVVHADSGHVVELSVADEIPCGRLSKQVALLLGWLMARPRTPPLTIAVLGCVLQQLRRNKRRREVRSLEAP
jgi:hypothetical protein